MTGGSPNCTRKVLMRGASTLSRTRASMSWKIARLPGAGIHGGSSGKSWTLRKMAGVSWMAAKG